MMNEVPAYVLLTAFSQLISRLGHPNQVVWELLRDLIGTIVVTHTHQALWRMMVASKVCLKQFTRCDGVNCTSFIKQMSTATKL